MTYAERVAIDCINYFEDFLEARDVRIPSSDARMKEEGSFHLNSARIYGEDFGELQEMVADPIVRAMTRISECVYDLTLVCAEFIRGTDVDSRMVFDRIHDWAEEFESQYCEDDDYMTTIEEFGERKLAELKEVLK